jgi:hypothetical protein
VADWPAALRAQLIAAGLAGGRISWGLRPEKASLPALVLTAIGGSVGRLTDGNADLRRSTVQADAYAVRHDEAWLLIEEVLAAVAAPFTRGEVRFASAGHGAPRTLPDTASDGTALFRASADLNFWHD